MKDQILRGKIVEPTTKDILFTTKKMTDKVRLQDLQSPNQRIRNREKKKQLHRETGRKRTTLNDQTILEMLEKKKMTRFKLTSTLPR